MADKNPAEAVKLTAPNGTAVTVSKDDVETFKGRGYKPASTRAAKPE